MRTGLKRRRVAGVVPGGGYTILVARIDKTTDPPSIGYETHSVLAWVTIEHHYRQPEDGAAPETNPYIETAPMILDPAGESAIEMSLAIPALNETAVVRVLQPGVTTLSKEENEELKNELSIVYEQHCRRIKPERKTSCLQKS